MMILLFYCLDLLINPSLSLSLSSLVSFLLQGTCAYKCGDGIQVQEEECDDGNNINGDGCNQYCIMESGFFCDENNKELGLPYCGSCVSDWTNTTQFHPVDNWVNYFIF
jgi:cysteine-rich repeat protein